MNIESLKTTLMTLSTPAGLAEQGSGQQAAVAATGRGVQGSAVPVGEDVVSVNRMKAASDKDEKKQPPQDNADAPRNVEIYKYKAVFAVDDDKNVVVRFVDKKGKVVQQVPPEEYLDMISKFKDVNSHLFSTEA